MTDTIAGVGIEKRSIFKSLNNGDSWQVYIDVFSGPSKKYEIAYSPTTNYIYVGSGTDLYIIDHTTNQQLKLYCYDYNFHADVRDIEIIEVENNYEKIVFANDGGISYLKTNITDISDHEVSNHSGHYLTANNLIGIGVGNSSAEFAMAGGVHGNSLKVANNIAYPGGDADGSDCLVHPENSDTYYHMSNAAMISSKSGTFHFDSDNWFIGMRYEMDPNNHDIIYFGQRDTFGIYNENTETVSLKEIPRNSNGEGMSWVGAIEKSSNGTLYISDFVAAGSNVPYRIVKSNNEGDSWTDMSPNAVYDANGNPDGILAQKAAWKTINSIESNPDNPNELWLCIGGIYFDNTYRVLHSTNGGNTWYDYSEGLSAFPANYIYYHYPTEMLFAATDAGVFYRDPSDNNMTEWACFSNNMPMGIVTDLDASTCNNMLYASLDGRGIYRTPIPFPIINGESNTINYENSILITGHEVWNNTRYFDGDIMIATDASLRINGSVLFTENGSITVLPKGELFLSGILDIAEPCSQSFWKGIQIRGHANSPQTPQYQGAIRTLDGAEIKNAEIGIAAYGIDNNGDMMANSQGGIIIVDHTKFIDNKIGIDFKDYTYSNINSAYEPVVIYSDFYTTTRFYHNFTDTPVNIQILNNNSISISKCKFYGNDYLPYLPYNSLYPIAVKIWSAPTNVNHCEFNNIGYGIYAMDFAAASHLVDIDNNIFYNCLKSIYLNGLSNPRITRNTIQGIHKTTTNQYLVYINECNNFIIEENTLRAWDPGHINPIPNFCVIINNCGASNNSIYKNHFKLGYCGILAQNQNRDESGINGLSIKCNVFEQAVRNNILVSARGSSHSNGIAAAQGSMGSNASDPAGNLFSLVFNNGGMTSTDAHFWNLYDFSAIVTYYHHATSNSLLLEPGYNNQNHLIRGVLRQVNSLAEWNDNSCPSHFPSGGDDPIGKMSLAANTMDITQNSLETLTDGGDTQALNTEVLTANDNEGYALRNELLNASPYISNTVLQNASNKEEALSNPLIRDVLVANPQAAKDQVILDAIDNRSQVMPTYMKQQILNGQTISGQKEQLEARLHLNRSEYNNALNYVIAKYNNDTTINLLDSMIPLLAAAKTLESQYQLAGIYLQHANATAMNNVLNNIPINFKLDDYHQTELEDLSAYYGLLQNAKANNRNIYELSETEKSELWHWRNDSINIASTYARNLLVYIGDLEYTAPIILPEMSNKSALITKPYDVDIPKDEYGVINIYPNPAKDYIICEYDIKFEFNKAQIIITEAASGKDRTSIFIDYKKDSKTIDIAYLKSGAYIVSLKVDGQIINSSKFNITK